MINSIHSINLLPPEEKKELLYKKVNRLIIILFVIFLTSLVFFTLSLLYIDFYIKEQIDLHIFNINSLIGTGGKNSLSIIEKSINNYNKEVITFKNFYDNQVYFSKMFNVFFNVELPKEIKILNIYSKKVGKIIETSVQGFSSSRDDLIKFKSNPEADKKIINPNFSSESWTKNENINFNLDFQYEN